MKRFLSPALKVTISLALLALVLRSVDAGRLRHDLARIELGRLALLLAVCWSGQLLCAQRWRLFAASLGMTGSYRSFVEMYFVGMLFNVGLPSLVGGDVVKAFVLSRKTAAPLGLGIASVLQDRAAGLISLVLYGSAAAAASPLRWRGIPLGLMYAAAWVGIAAVLGVVWKGERLYGRWNLARRDSLLSRGLASAADFHRALATMRLSRWDAAQVIGYSLVNSALVLWVFQQVSTAAGHTVGFVSFAALCPLVTLATMLPISLGGLGIREWAYIEALGVVGVPAQVALTIALTSSALIIVFDLAGLLFLPTVPADLRQKTP